jgi:putative ABC transport system permease protein
MNPISFYKKYMHDIATAIDALKANKVKSFLTMLGIMFGVAAVISMLAIGKGAKKEVLEQIKWVGANNIIITPKIEDKKSKKQDEQEQKKEVKRISLGLNMEDALAIQQVVPTVERVCPEIIIDKVVMQNGKKMNSKISGITPDYFKVFNMQLAEGDMFDAYQLLHGLPVCIIGADIKTKIFNNKSPVGDMLKCGTVWLKVIAVLEKREISRAPGAGSTTNINDINSNVYIPVKSMLLRFQNRSLITASNFSSAMYGDENNIVMFQSGDGMGSDNYNQLDKIVVQVKETDQVIPTRDIIQRILLRKHANVPDFDVTVPELMLKQEKRTRTIFNIVLGVIAGISLLVGGIGIMNIMLASVMERIREIGTRQALGATRKNIMVQFLAEAVLISLTGGFIGIIFGVIFSFAITKITGVLSIISLPSVLIAFLISVTIGIIFGFMPAKKAAEKDPIESLRYE